MAKFIIDGVTLEQAVELAHWYEGQGEQEADTWFSCRDDNPAIRAPYVDVGRTGGWMKTETNSITIYARSDND